MSMFKKAARALFGRPRKAAAVAAATTLLVVSSVVPAFAQTLYLNYDTDLYKNTLLGTEQYASLSLSADLDSDDFVAGVGGNYVSYVDDWKNLGVSVTTGAGTYVINSSNLDALSVAPKGNPTSDFMLLDSNNNIIAWNFDFWNTDYSTANGVDGLRIKSSVTTDAIIADAITDLYPDESSACVDCGIKTLHTPEPSTMLTFGLGLLGLAWLGRRGVGRTSAPSRAAVDERASAQASRIGRRANRRDLTS